MEGISKKDGERLEEALLHWEGGVNCEASVERRRIRSGYRGTEKSSREG